MGAASAPRKAARGLWRAPLGTPALEGSDLHSKHVGLSFCGSREGASHQPFASPDNLPPTKVLQMERQRKQHLKARDLNPHPFFPSQPWTVKFYAG